MHRKKNAEIESRLAEFEAAKAYHRELYRHRDEFSCKRDELERELEALEHPHMAAGAHDVETVLQAATNRRRRIEEIEEQLQAVDDAVIQLEDEFHNAFQRERQAESMLLEARHKAANEALEALQNSAEFKKFSTRLAEVMALASVASASQLGGRLDRKRWVAKAFDGVEPTARQMALAREALMVE